MLLENISFGDRVAENEAETLSTYFIETQPWKKLYRGEVDVVFGTKGAGKSALYTLLLKKSKDLLHNNIFLLSAEKPTGKTVFSDITNQPPTSEDEFVTLWKVYFCQLITNWLIENHHCNDDAKGVADALIKAGLIQEKNTLQRFLKSATEFVSNLFKIESVEGGGSVDGTLTGKITFRTPSPEQRDLGFNSIDDLLEILNKHLEKIGKTCWILCDRLDVAFDQSLELEKNALRALFKTYRDMEEYNFICLKVFLRDDIWNRITKDGFREASHITRTVSISWNNKNLLNLIVSRALQNKEIVEKYKVNPEDILANHDLQNEFYYNMFPNQIDVGERQSDTFEWILSRIRDGLNNTPPRELIHYYNESLSQELREQEISNNKVEEPNIISRTAIKNAANDVSKVRTEQTIFAEFPEFKNHIMAFENKKAEHDLSTLSKIWSITENEAKLLASALTEIGFFDSRTAKNERLYKIPFIYRFYLNVTQGKAY